VNENGVKAIKFINRQQKKIEMTILIENFLLYGVRSAFNSLERNTNKIINMLDNLNFLLNLKLEKHMIMGVKQIHQAMFIFRIEGSNIENILVIIFRIFL